MSGVCVCGCDRLWPLVDSVTAKYREIEGKVLMYYHVCPECRSEVATPEDMTANKDEMMCFKKAIDKQLDGV